MQIQNQIDPSFPRPSHGLINSREKAVGRIQGVVQKRQADAIQPELLDADKILARNPAIPPRFSNLENPLIPKPLTKCIPQSRVIDHFGKRGASGRNPLHRHHPDLLHQPTTEIHPPQYDRIPLPMNDLGSRHFKTGGW